MAGRTELRHGACPGIVASRSTLSAALGLVGTPVETGRFALHLVVCRMCPDGSALVEVVLVPSLYLVEDC